MAILDGMRIKFIVIKNEDIEKYLSPVQRKQLADLLEEIHNGRRLEGKSTDQKYLVINTDEPYADEVIEILKRNRHWG